MKYLKLRLSCLMHGHDWRETTSPSGLYSRCRRCCAERPAPQAGKGTPAGV